MARDLAVLGVSGFWGWVQGLGFRVQGLGVLQTHMLRLSMAGHSEARRIDSEDACPGDALATCPWIR